MKRDAMEARRESVFKPLRRAGWEQPEWFFKHRLTLGGFTLHCNQTGSFELYGPPDQGIIARFSEQMPARAVAAAAKEAGKTITDVLSEANR